MSPPLQSLRDKLRTLSLARSSHQRADSLPVALSDRDSPSIPPATALGDEGRDRRRRRRRRWPFSRGGEARAASKRGGDGSDDDSLASSTASRLPTDPAAYELLEVVGRGMTANVYSARVATSTEGRGPKRSKRVAVKVVDLDALSDEAMESVLRETRLLSKLRHRGLAPLLSSFVADRPSEASLWLVMPLASTSARDVLDTAYRGRGLPERSAAAIIHSVAEALCYAHSQGVVHRDVKAQNVLLFSCGESGEGDDDEGGEGQEEGDEDSLSSRPPPRGTARLSDLGSGNANDALLASVRGGGGSVSFSRRRSGRLAPALSASSSPPSSLLGGGGGGGGGATGSRVSFTRTSLSTLREHEAPESSRALREQHQRQQKALSPSPSARARDARAAAARKLSTYKTFAGSPAWMAPEVVEQGPGGYHGPACDIYSLGALLVELATGQPPMASLPYETLMMEKLHGEAPTLDLSKTPGPYGAEAADLAAACMDRDPARRPTAREVLSCPWLERTYYGHEDEGEGRRRRLLRRKSRHHHHHHQGCDKGAPAAPTRAEAAAAASPNDGEKRKETERDSFKNRKENAAEARCAVAAEAAAEEEIGALIEQWREAKLDVDERSNKTVRSEGSSTSAATSRSSPAPSTQSRWRPSPSTPVIPSVSASAASSSSAVSSAAEALRQQRRKASLPPPSPPLLPLHRRGSSGGSGIFASAMRRFGSGGSSEPGTPRTAPASVVAGGVGAGAGAAGEGEEGEFEEDPAGLWDSSGDPHSVFGPDWARGVLRLMLFPTGVKARLERQSSSSASASKEEKGCGNGIKRHARAAVLDPPISELLPDLGGLEREDERERLRGFLHCRAVLVTCRDVRSSPSPSSDSVDASSYTRSLTAAFFRVPAKPEPLALAERGALARPGASARERAAALAAAADAGHAIVPAGRSAWAGPIYFFSTQRADSARPRDRRAMAEQLRSEMRAWERRVAEHRREEGAEREEETPPPPASAFAAAAAVEVAADEGIDAGAVPAPPPTVPISKKRAQSLGSKLLVRMRRSSFGGDGGDDDGGGDAPPPQRALEACEASSIASEVILSPCELREEHGRAAAGSAPKGRKKSRRKAEENGVVETTAADVNDGDGNGGDLPLPASLLGATLHVLRTPFAASRLAYFLLKASEVAINAEEEHGRRLQEEEQEERRQGGKGQRNGGGKQNRRGKPAPPPPRSALRLGGEPLNPIPGDDLPPAMTLASGRGAFGPLYSASKGPLAPPPDAAGNTKKKAFSSWLVPATDLTAAAHGKERCVVSSVPSESENGPRKRNAAVGGSRSPCAVGGCPAAKTLDVASLFAGRLPPPPSWRPFIEDLQAAQELAARAREEAKKDGKNGKEKADDDVDGVPLLLETAASMVSLSSEASLPVSPFANVPNAPSRSGSAS